MQKKISLKKPNLVEARNWIAEQQFCRKKKTGLQKSNFAKKKKKKKTQNSWPYNTRRNKKT